jgi:DNA polymerase-2
MAMTLHGWLIDVYPSHNGVTLWLMDEEGRYHRHGMPFVPSFCMSVEGAERRRAEAMAAKCPVRVSTSPQTKTEIYSGEAWEVLSIHVHEPLRFAEAVRYFERSFPHYVFFDSDILVSQLFLYETRLFPLALGDYVVDEAGVLKEWSLRDDNEAMDYELPPLSMMWLRTAGDFVPPKYRKVLQLEVTYEGRTYALEQGEPADVLRALNHHLHRFDPDILLTQHGDATLLPHLTQLAQRFKIPLMLNRDQTAAYFTARESSFFQYGKIVHKDGAFELAGRLHIDLENSFTVAEADLEGIFELARLTRIPIQREARASIGTSMSSMQLAWAYQHNILIPSKKREPEEFKSAATLLLADRGGLIFNPPQGYHEDVAELDFVSMYPTIMIEHNVSPETINCWCCKNRLVPELGYSICERRRGIVSETLKPVVIKRAHYKKLKKEYKQKFVRTRSPEDEALFRKYDRRQNALKWMLVSCFGYLGYKNARFGRIEAHEAVNAFSRDAILRAKEIAEAEGFHLLHAIIDCLWLKKDGATEHDYERLCRKIAEKVGIDISLEGIYSWILFPSSKQDVDIATANRYAGWYRHGEMKTRGIEVRRRDTPVFIKNMQNAMLEQLSSARNVEEVKAMMPGVLESLRPAMIQLSSGKANPMELVLKRHITREAHEYTTNTISATVARLVEVMGVHLAAGERIEFIIIDQSGKKKPEKAKPLALYAFEDGYDCIQYTELALKAIETIALPFGYDVETLTDFYKLKPEKKRKAVSRPDSGQSELFPTIERFTV